ncbi:MAG: OmpA family protein, partial [Flavisolibacter sp.]
MFDPYNMKTTSLSTSTHPRRIFVKSLGVKAFLLVLASSVCIQARSQSDKRLVMADQYYTAGDYYTAAGLYGQFLNPAVKPKYHSDFPLNVKRNAEGRTGNYQNKTAILFKQAESYRLAHYWSEASTLYQQCFEKDSIKYASAMYWKAVCQRSLGEYAGAEENLNRYFNEVGQGNEYYKAAVDERQTIQFIRKQLARPDSVLYYVQKINTAIGDKGIFAPVAVTEDQYLFTSTSNGSAAFNANPYHNRLFSSELINGSLQSVQPLLIESIDSSFNQGVASVSADGKYLYFTQWKKDGGQTVSSIYFSSKNNNGWSSPKYLNSINQQGHSSKQPFCSSDGKYLFFASDRPGGAGGFDIWYAPIEADGTTGAPMNAGATVNSSANEEAPFYYNGSTSLIFASNRQPGMGGYDLFSAKGPIGEWKTIENMGYPVNSSRDDVYFFARESKNLLDNAFVSSDRGSECCLSAYTITKTPKRRIIRGVVVDCSNNLPLEDAQVTMLAAGKTLLTKTTAEGKYSFELADDNQEHQFTASKEKYNDKATDVAVESMNETNWQADTLNNGALCLEKKFVLKVENDVTVYFDFDKSDIKERGSEQLDSIYQVMSANPSYTLQISGYTDGKGSVEYNKKLSDRRARSC